MDTAPTSQRTIRCRVTCECNAFVGFAPTMADAEALVREHLRDEGKMFSKRHALTIELRDVTE